MKRTDKNRISWPRGTSSEDRRFARDLIKSLTDHLNHHHVIIACSGGLDSTVLAHAYKNACAISSYVETSLMYINHKLRTKEEILIDINHVTSLGKEFNMNIIIDKINIGSGNIQIEARTARYEVLAKAAHNLNGVVLLAHHANDIAESKLFQFLTGRKVIGIAPKFTINNAYFFRPLLKFTRNDLERYAKIWNLSWSEDSSNTTDKYTRNKIRHHLIPWIENEINPGIVSMLSK